MKNNNIKSTKFIKKIIILIIAMCTLTFFACGLSRAYEQYKIADSGHGTSYHSGGHRSSRSSSRSSSGRTSSSRSSSSSYHGSSSGGGTVTLESVVLTFIIFGAVFACMIILVIVSSIKQKNKRPGMNNLYNTNDENFLMNKIKKAIPNFNKKEFLDNGYKIYVDVQNAWMNFKLDDVKGVITDEMYNMYTAQLDLMKVKGEQNIMSDFVKCNAFLKNVSIQNNTIAITAIYIVEFYDYVINQQSGKVLRGSKSKKVRITYELTYRKTLDESTVIDKCPNCGAKIEDANGSATCKYCGSKLVYNNSDWILTNKKNILQTWA